MAKTTIQVQLTGSDGNAFAVVGKVSRALRQAGEHALAEEFQTEAFSGDYTHVLATCMDYVEVS